VILLFKNMKNALAFKDRSQNLSSKSKHCHIVPLTPISDQRFFQFFRGQTHRHSHTLI